MTQRTQECDREKTRRASGVGLVRGVTSASIRPERSELKTGRLPRKKEKRERCGSGAAGGRGDALKTKGGEEEGDEKILKQPGKNKYS